MTEQLSTPRITASYLDSFVGRVVMLVGKVTQLRGDQATLDSDGTVTVLLNRDAHLANGNTVQVIGKVNPDLSIKVLTSRDLGAGVDHGRFEPSQQPPYTPRVAMVWSSLSRTQPTPTSLPDGQGALATSWSSDSQYDFSNSVTPDLMSPTIPPTRELQPPTYSMSDDSRPSTATSFPQYDGDLDHPTPSSSSRSAARSTPTSGSNLSIRSARLAPESDDSALFASVLDGIARIHVTMGRDEAGRWRIRWTGDEAS
ncbi:hypothetical protein G7Z17_g9930 [Cylindrodendrum hubeiense]|uniref:Uncharacterized protein n=1 Tax=Cylindrodendrum hubeiense TaxID=595255 RepID=A0A9P5LBQ8_9HYPO|nr:hypothetical protein G7Z17_g9930 [Cylindrodendrum hubeiense]